MVETAYRSLVACQGRVISWPCPGKGKGLDEAKGQVPPGQGLSKALPWQGGKGLNQAKGDRFLPGQAFYMACPASGG